MLFVDNLGWSRHEQMVINCRMGMGVGHQEPPQTNDAFLLHGMARYSSLLGGFPLGTVPGTWYFFSTTSAGAPSNPYRYQNVTYKLYWSLIGRRKSPLLHHRTMMSPQ